MAEPDSASPVQEGEIIAGKYRVERILGIGGMGVVVAAMHLELEQRVALKFLLPQAVAHPDVSARFAREARAAAKIRCEHVARVIDVGTLPGGAPYMVMEYMQGEDLEHVLARVGPMRSDIAVDYVLQAAEAIAEAHALGIVHRDLKPANLFLAARPSGDPIVKVLDFGISKSTMTKSDAQLTKTSSIMGSPLYMSPEQMTSAKSVDSRSDIWALGVVLYELLTRRTPFPAETMPELVAAILQATIDPVRTMRPDVHPALDAAILRCLEKNPANRFSNVAELAVALAPFGLPRSAQSVERISHVLGASAGVAVTPRGAAPVAVAQGYATQSPANAPAGGIAQTHAPWAESVPGTPSGASTSRVGLFVGLGAAFTALLVAGIGTALWVHQKGQADPVVAAAPPMPAIASAPSVAPTTAPPSPAPAAPATASADTPAPPSTSDSTPPAPAPTRTPAPPPAQRAAAQAAPPRATAPATPACRTVSYFDADGNKRFKQECK